MTLNPHSKTNGRALFKIITRKNGTDNKGVP